MHDVLVWGPAAEGELTARGNPVPMPGWVWTCSCGASGFGYATEQEADEWAERHEASA